MILINRLVVVVITAILMTINFVSVGQGQVGQSKLVNPDIATEKDLLALPHMNAALAKSIIEHRPFLSIADLNTLLAKSLSKEQIVELYVKMFVQINLNTASDDEINLIPGMGRRMLREFKEYRPYKIIGQFRKEIGKYVDDKEVARLEQYIFVPINLNNGSDEDILSIPGLSKRLLSDLKGGRPYANIEQLRKEIGKSVDKKEVARLERYISLN